MNWDGSYGHVVRGAAKSFHWLRQNYPPLPFAPQRISPRAVTPTCLIGLVRMPKRLFFRWILPAAAGMLTGFLALAYAVPSESVLPVSLVALFSPGLKVAEFLMPAAHESLAWTFGWFLRIAIGVNAVFYFAIFALLAYLADRRRSQTA